VQRIGANNFSREKSVKVWFQWTANETGRGIGGVGLLPCSPWRLQSFSTKASNTEKIQTRPQSPWNFSKRMHTGQNPVIERD